jgi:hypothetical protein
VVPGGEELMGIPLENDTHLKAVRKSTPYSSEEEYMDTYFRLHRADCFASIQKVIILVNTHNMDGNFLESMGGVLNITGMFFLYGGF